MLAASAVLFISSILVLSAAWVRARKTGQDESRMTGYVASLRAVADGHRHHVLELEQALKTSQQLLAAQDRLLEGQASHLRSLDVDYAG